MRPRHLLVSGVLALLLGCAPGGDDPRMIAEEFWQASQAGDMDLARTYVSASSEAKLNERDKSDSNFGEVVLGEASYDGDEAMVETSLSGSGDMQLELSFNTVLVREDGTWKIDLDRTTGEMTQALFGTTMGEVAEQMGRAVGEAMGEAVRGMAEGMAEGLEAMGDSLRAATADTSDRQR